MPISRYVFRGADCFLDVGNVGVPPADNRYDFAGYGPDIDGKAEIVHLISRYGKGVEFPDKVGR